MSRKESQILDLHTRKGTWKLALRLTEMWLSQRKNGKKAIEMVFIDEKGSKIGATLYEDLFATYQSQLKEGSAYVIQNIKVLDNNSEYKVSRVPYSLVFVTTTHLKEADRPEIPQCIYTVTPFAKIISGEATRDALVDIVGVVADLLEQFTVKPTFRVSVKLKDNSGDEMIMTVWEEYAAKLGAAIDKSRVDKSPIVVMLTLAKIKDETDKYPLSVHNHKAWSKLYINEDVPPIQDFYKSLDLNQSFYTQASSTEGGQTQSKYSQSSKNRSYRGFLHNARIVSLEEIQRLRQDEFCLTVGTVNEILIDSPWCYDSCPNCTTGFAASNFGQQCRTCYNIVTKTVPRFRVAMKLECNGVRATFNFWDAIMIKIIGKTAEECRQELIKDGEDVKIFPACLDDLLEKKWAIRFKFRIQMRQSNVVDFTEDIETIRAIESNIASKLDNDCTEIRRPIPGDSSSQECHPTPSVSQSADYDPSVSQFMTPAKRKSAQIASDEIASPDYAACSTNKIIKSEK